MPISFTVAQLALELGCLGDGVGGQGRPDYDERRMQDRLLELTLGSHGHRATAEEQCAFFVSLGRLLYTLIAD